MRKLGLIIVAVLFLLPIWAQNFNIEALQGISLEAAKEKALNQNQAYQAKAAAYSAASWGKSSAKAAFLPSLSLSGTLLYMDPATTVTAGTQTYTLNHDSRTVSLNLSQPLYLGGKLWQAYKISFISEEMAALNLQNQRYTLLTEVESKYLGALQVFTLYKIGLSELKSAEDNLALAKIKQENGLLARSEILRFQSRLASKQVSTLQAQTALQLALQDFANYLGEPQLLMPLDISLDSETANIEELDAYDLAMTNSLSERALQLALQRNLNYQILDKSVELSDRAYALAKGSFWPAVMLTGSRQYRENGIDRYDLTASNQIMLTASIPILPQLGNYSAAKKAKEEARKAALEAKTATDSIKLGLQSAVLNWISSAKQVQSAAMGLSYSEELYSQMQERFRLNMLSPLELLDTELMLSAARMTNTIAFYTYLKARGAVMQALALEDVNDLYSLIRN
ncbi:MAG: TolC family protein [Candidatus Cloacimonas sp.]|jgi:outer membrane protein TolC|nr:TolC family protein [Candidatus Cloacimonas sp.]